MSEGKYGRLPTPKDRSKKRVDVKMGDLELTPEHDKAGEWAEEGGVYHPHVKRVPEESTMAKLGRMASEFGASVSKPWAKLTGEDDEE